MKEKEIHVLFLDDEEKVLNSVRRIFINEPYAVAVANNYVEAMAIIAREKIKVVLSDQRMPDIPGVEFLRRVRVQYPNIIRILFTAYADLTVSEQAINVSEVFRFINKPWHPDELKATVVSAMYHYDLIAENHRLFESLKIKNDELLAANDKLRVLYDIQKDFSSTVSHELRTPLASIKAAIDIVVSGTAGDPTDEQKMFLGRAKDNIDRLNRLINNILDLAHMESGKVAVKFQPGDLNRTIQSVADNQESVAKTKGLSVHVSLDPNMPVVYFDSDKIIQVLNNLMTNAIKFTESGGITVISRYLPDAQSVEVKVQDTGCGIKKEDLSKLFEKFQQLGESHRKYSGTGLGLAICKEIVRQHGGKVGVESQDGQGSCFSFSFPVSVRTGGKDV